MIVPPVPDETTLNLKCWVFCFLSSLALKCEIFFLNPCSTKCFSSKNVQHNSAPVAYLVNWRPCLPCGFVSHLFRPRFTLLDFSKEKKKKAVTKHMNGRITLKIRRSLQFSFVHSAIFCVFYSHHDSLRPNRRIRK